MHIRKKLNQEHSKQLTRVETFTHYVILISDVLQFQSIESFTDNNFGQSGNPSLHMDTNIIFPLFRWSAELTHSARTLDEHMTARKAVGCMR